MKRLSFILVLVAFAFSVNAQKIGAYVKAGANLGKIDGQSFEQNFNLAYHAGVAVEIGLTKKIGLQPEVYFSQTQTKVTNSTGNLTPNKDAQLNYLSIPLLLKINAGKYVAFHFGPEYGILMNKDSSLVSNGKQAVKNGNFSFIGGLQFNLGAAKIYGRYNIGLTNISDLSNTGDWKTQQIQIGLAYSIF